MMMQNSIKKCSGPETQHNQVQVIYFLLKSVTEASERTKLLQQPNYQ